MALHLLPLAEVEVGGYLSIWKILTILVVLLIWMRLLTWVDKDTTVAYLPREPINSAFIGGAALAFALFFILPNFWIGFGIVMFVLLAELGTYLGLRSKKVGLADLKTELANMFAGKKKSKEHKTVEGEVALLNRKGAVITPPIADAPDAPAFLAVQQILSDPLVRGAERIDMAPTEGVAAIRYQVDGVSYNATSIDVPSSQAAVTYIKGLAGLDLEEKRKPQKGKMKVAVAGKRLELEVQTAGSAAGEFLKFLVDPKKRHALRLEELGLDQDQLPRVQEMIKDPGGIVIVATPKGQGLTSLLFGIIRAHDAFLTHIHTIERAPEDDLEGITQNPIAAAATPEEEFKQVDWVASQEPDVIMLTFLESPKSALSLIKFASEGNRRVYVGIRANSTFQALDTWRKLVGDDAAAINSLRMVICGRVLRRLCNACKVGYAPDPEMLRKQNIDPSRVTQLFQARAQPMRDPKGNPIPCNFCKELRYQGRFGVFEILNVDDDVKQIVASGGSVNQLKAVMRKQRAKFIHEVALARVLEGETSIQEMRRVLLEGQSGATEGAAPSKPAAAPAGAAPAGKPAPRPGTGRPPSRPPGKSA